MSRAQDASNQALAALEAWAPNPAGGLPEELFRFISRFVPIINVDLLIRDERDRTLLTWREDAIYGAGWHVPGGIIRYKETAANRVHATALRELGASVAFDHVPAAIEETIAPERRERGHFISLLYRCRLSSPPEETRRFSGGRPAAGQWAWHARCPPDLLPVQEPYRRFFA
jgi:colanic acid biosynthesis protein WcaH